MDIKTLSKKVKPIEIIVSIIFFIFSSYIFYIYKIDLSLLLILFIIIVFNNFLKNEKTVSLLDFYLLATFAILAILIFSLFFGKNFLIPTISFSLLITTLFSSLELSLIFSLFVVLLEVTIIKETLDFGIILFTVSFIVALFSLSIRRRFQIIKAALIGGIVCFFLFLFLRLNSFVSLIQIINFLKNCFIESILASIIVIGVLPICELIFRVTTNISLLELSDINHPLLKRLILEAPGTYQHSLVVANLSEAAAEAIGANMFLARVGAYYHDIGKILKSEYFVENIVGYKDVHKNLKPSMSKLIIINHVKDGIELAKKYHLNPKIIDFIAQHHGRTLVYFFYQKAKELEPQVTLEEEYRYPGPKPQSPEVAIVSLADTIEALSRTFDEPTPSRIEEMVKDVIKKRFLEGELDESKLTLRDLEKITQSFIRMLNALFHTRINYPKNEDRNQKSTKNSKTQS
ncbi:MAG: HDIG domain-containing protein [Candidatus Omnitrophica bacterium]|nr:HDIG domain-containing protein [Candidatus Omnitrophota bacterium]